MQLHDGCGNATVKLRYFEKPFRKNGFNFVVHFQLQSTRFISKPQQKGYFYVTD